MSTNMLGLLYVFDVSRHKHVIESWCFIQVHRGVQVNSPLNRDGKN
jgi:hypothetical protein